MRITHQHIADKLGVSRSLVTCVLHGTGRITIKDETRDTIVRVAREMGYRPRGLTTRTIGYLMSGYLFSSQPEMQFVVAAERALRQRGYRMTLISRDMPDGQSLEDVVNSKMLDGLFIEAWEDGRFASLLSDDLPFLLLSEEPVGPGIEQVTTDLQGAATCCLRYLRQMGHRRVAISLGSPKTPFNLRLKQACLRAATEVDWPEGDLIIVDKDQAILSGASVLELMRTAQPPTAVIVSDDQRALSAYSHFMRNGLMVPEDISMLSLFDSHHYHFTVPALSSFTVDQQVLVETAVGRLLEKINVPETIPRQSSLQGAIVERGSVRNIGPT